MQILAVTGSNILSLPSQSHTGRTRLVLPWKDNCTLHVLMVQRHIFHKVYFFSLAPTLLCRLRRRPEIVLPDINLSVCTAKYRNRECAHLVLNKVGEELPSFLSRHSGMDNDIVARPPVRRGCHLVPISELKGY
jgi:hypothetical protein